MDMRALESLWIVLCVLVSDVPKSGGGFGLNFKSTLANKFNFYKLKYHKKYGTETEESQAFHNFVKNLEFTENANKEMLDPKVVYMINGLADMDPVGFEEHYGVTIRPYNSELSETLGENSLRMKKQDTEEHKHREMMYDLDESQKLYEKFLKKYNKTKPRNKKWQQLRYLRFVKTLADINKQNFINDDNVTYDENADQLQNPKEYFFD